MDWVGVTTSETQTEAVAASLAARLIGGECIALDGQLGAGKTRFVRGLLRGLGADPRVVSSPTYVLLNVYRQGRLAVHHLDAYRVAGEDDFEAIGFTELIEQAGVVVVEWATRISRLIPPNAIYVTMTTLGPRRREIRISGLRAGDFTGI